MNTSLQTLKINDMKSQSKWRILLSDDGDTHSPLKIQQRSLKMAQERNGDI